MSVTSVAPAAVLIPQGRYVLDPAHSRVGFSVRHAMVTKVRGAFSGVTGTGVVGEDGSGSLEVVVDVASIDTRNADRDAHLRSGDFFDVERFPSMVFVASEAVQEGEQVRVSGDLTIRDVTRPVSFVLEFTGRATDPFGNDRVGLEGQVVVNRTDWGLTWNAALEAGGLLVGEKVTLEFEISAIREAA